MSCGSKKNQPAIELDLVEDSELTDEELDSVVGILFELWKSQHETQTRQESDKKRIDADFT